MCYPKNLGSCTISHTVVDTMSQTPMASLPVPHLDPLGRIRSDCQQADFCLVKIQNLVSLNSILFNPRPQALLAF